MKLGKAHLIASLLMTACSVVYTVWSLSGPSAVTAVARDAGVPPPMAAPAVAGAVAVDPTQIPPVPDVVLDRLPEWPRNPFGDIRRPEVAPAIVEAVEPVVPSQVDIVVASILISKTRRVAVINGRRMTVGDQIDGATVIDILPNAVVLDHPQFGRRTVARRTVGGRSAGDVMPANGGRQ